jgi:hypothetical protein
LELWAPCKTLWVWAVRSKNICFGHVPIAIRQGRQRRDVAASGKEQLGKFTALRSKYNRL